MGIYCSSEPHSIKLYKLMLGFSLACFSIYIIRSITIFQFEGSEYIRNYIQNIGQILVIIPYLVNILFSDEKKFEIKNKKAKNTKKDYILFALIIIIKFFGSLISSILKYKRQKEFLFFDYISDINILLFLTLLINFSSDSKIYRHKLLSVLMTVILIITYELFSVNLEYIFFFYSSFLISIYYFYQQTLIRTQNISFYIFCSLFGLIDFIVNIIIGNIFYYYSFNEKLMLISAFYREQLSKNFFLILLKSLLSIICYIIIYIIFYLIIFNYTIIHAFIFNIIFDLCEILIFFGLNYDAQIPALIIFFLVLINYTIYIEILELSCCGLNKNTRRNILKRIKEEEFDEDINNENIDINRIELSKGYLVDLNEIPNEPI